MTGFCLICGANVIPDVAIVAGDLVIDHARGRATLRGTALPLTPSEFGVLHSIAKAGGQLVSKPVISERIGHEGDGNVVDVLLSRMRRKVMAAGAPDPVTSVRGLGVRLADAFMPAAPAS